MPPTLKRVIRLDSTPLTRTHFTDEGYLKDRPVLTSTGIFEYLNSDGSIRRELRLPEEVFNQDSLESYKGKPIIITHSAGLVTKDNVHKNTIGTILSTGIKSGDDVRADIIIHDTDRMKDCGFKELSLGYNLDLDETPGVWKGQKYDAIQRNIMINHLALVKEARAGEQARLNIDSKDSTTLIGGKKSMKKTSHADGLLNEAELEQAIAEYKERRAKKAQSAQKDAMPEELDEKKKAEEMQTEEVQSEETDQPEEVPEETPENAEIAEEPAEEAPEENLEEPVDDPAIENEAEEPVEEPAEEPVEEPVEEPQDMESKLNSVKERRNVRDEHGDPADMSEAMGQIAEQDEDIDILYDIIDTLLAEREFVKSENTDSVDEEEEDDEETFISDSEDDEEEFEDEFETDEDDTEEEVEDEEMETEPDDDMFIRKDSIDAIVKTRIQLGMIGRQLNMDGLENYDIKEAKKKIINKIRPSMNLDGKSDAFVDGAYRLAMDVIDHKGTEYQKRQMFNKDSVDEVQDDGYGSSNDHRKAMIERMSKGGTR